VNKEGHQKNDPPDSAQRIFLGEKKDQIGGDGK
jgi:hypothetical protein